MINLKLFQKIQFTFSVFIIVFFTSLVFSQPKIEKVEPPNWWANHSINPVRLLVRGENFQNAKVSSANKSLQISNVKINNNSTYLFFDVTIAPNAKPAKYEFDVTTDKGKSKIPFEILPTPKVPNTITNEDVIYLIMTDRFSDGDTSNNVNVDKTNPRMWHGGDFRGIINRLNYLKELGITAIWLTPWYDNSDEVTTCDKPWCPMASYHGYGAIDYYGVENHFGNLNDLKELVRKANEKGIKVVQDQVANHVGFRHPWMKNPPLENWFPPFVQNKFNNSSLLSPNASKEEVDNTLKGWFDFSLPDMNYDEPEVVKYEIQNALWWIATTGISGIRQDTIQYMPRKFINEWSSAIQKQYPNFYMVGEVFEEDSAHTAFFQGGKTGWDGIDTKLPSVFDFKLWRTSQEVFTGKKPMRALRDVLKYDGLYGNINRITVMTNNHDTDRFMSLPNATKEGAKLHTAFILATRGISQLYYGEEVLMTGGHDPDNRKDFTKFDKSSRTADEQEMFEWTQKWIKIRREDSFLKKLTHAGNGVRTVDLFYDKDVYVFQRYWATEMAAALIDSNIVYGFNHSNEFKKVEINKFLGFPDVERFKEMIRNAAKRKGLSEEEVKKEIQKSSPLFTFELTSLFDSKDKISVDESGKFLISLPPKSAIAYKIHRKL